MPTRATKRAPERTPLSVEPDVLICGASFAGLAVARELAGSGADVLVTDRYAIGERQTSACGIPTAWLQQLGLMKAERQRFEALVVHTPHGTSSRHLPWTFSTFDYRELCRLLWRDCDARFETATVVGRATDGVAVETLIAARSRFRWSSTHSVGAGSWRAGTASSRRKRRSPADLRSTRAGRARISRICGRPPLRARWLWLVVPGRR